MNETCVRTQDLCYSYAAEDEETKQPEVLSNVNIEVGKGEFVAVLGHNGSGKSTFARLLNALLVPTGGKVYIEGMDTADEAHLWDIRRAAGMVFQNPDNQLVASVVEDDVAFGPENIGVDPKEIRIRVDEALAAVKMQDYALRAPHLLSGGQKQRIAIAGVLALKPDIVVMDEPTAMLDPQGREEVMQTIKNLVAEGITVILITHYMQEALQASRIIVMNHGSVLLDGTPQEVFAQRDTLLACGLELPAMAELNYLLRREGFDIPPEIMDTEGMAQAICRLISKT